MIQINCRGLTLGYDSALVRDLSFDVHAGDYLCILGENGAGKSTLMKTLLGLLSPLEGSVTSPHRSRSLPSAAYWGGLEGYDP